MIHELDCLLDTKVYTKIPWVGRKMNKPPVRIVLGRLSNCQRTLTNGGKNGHAERERELRLGDRTRKNRPCELSSRRCCIMPREKQLDENHNLRAEAVFSPPYFFSCDLGRIADHMNRTEAHCFETVESPDHAIATTKSSPSPTSRHTPQQNPRETSSTVPAPPCYIQRRTHQTPVARVLPYKDHAIPSS